MAVTSNKFILGLSQVAVYIGYMMLRCIFRIVQKGIWYINGTAEKIRDAKKSENYARCAQVLDIRMCYYFNTSTMWSRRNFVCTHNRFESPRYIIENDHVTLVTIDDEYVIFGEARERGMQLWKSEYSPFMTFSQFLYCNKLILVPLEHFHRMTEELERIEMERIVFLFNTGRCGSTLMVQIMENTGRCVSISEPEALNALKDKPIDNNMTKEDLSRLCTNLVRWICRPCTNFKPLFYFIKVCGAHARVHPVIQDAFPRSKYLFMYRNIADNIRSLSKLLQTIPFYALLSQLAKISGSVWRWLYFNPKVDYMYLEHEGLRDHMGFAAAAILRGCKTYVDSLRKRFPIVAIRYEDLISHPKTSVTQIFEYCDIPRSLVDSAMRAFAWDSQRNTILSKENVKNQDVLKLSERSRSFANELLRQYGLPLLEEECVFEGTIAFGN